MLDQVFGSFANYIIMKIDEYSPIKRRRDYDTKYCLHHVCRVLKGGIPWNYLGTESHYTTVYKRFIRWKHDKVFEKIWKEILDKYCLKQSSKDNKWADTLIIDSTMIKNDYRIDMTGFNHFDRNRQATKQSIICDKNYVPLSCTYYPANVHDSLTIENSIEQLSCLIRENDRFNNTIIADSAYIINETKRKNILSKYKIKLIAQPRKNMKQLVPKDAKLLKAHRSKIESLFHKLDCFKRLRSRCDRFIDNYATFNFMAMISLTLKRMT